MFLTAIVALTCCVQAQESPSFDKFAVNSLFNKEVQRELELVEDQTKEISSLLERLTSKRDELAAELEDLKADGASQEELEDRRDGMLHALEREKQDVQKQVFRVLLPHQAQRLREISAQYFNREAMKKNRNQTGLLTPEMLEYLGIEAQQAERIKERSNEIRKRLTEQIKKLNEEAIEELLSELTPQQREKYQKLMGQRFVK